MSFRKKLIKSPVVKFLSSIKITVICLSLLFILTFWGTVDQVSNGLYHAQEQFFHSLIFLVFGFLPFPGAQLVLWVLFVNLSCVAITRFVYKKSHIGILIIHFGLLTYFVSAFVTLKCVEETNLMLMEGAASNTSSFYHNWELSVWEKDSVPKPVIAFDSDDLKPGVMLNLEEFDTKILVKEYYKNSKALVLPKAVRVGLPDIEAIKEAPLEKEPEKNIAGGVFRFISTDGSSTDVKLFGGLREPLKIQNQNQVFYVQLRRKRSVMPFVLKLVDFRMEKHPNTEVARSYESLVQIESNNLSREVLISMNEPLRYKNYTLYQASYAIDEMGRQLSTLAVVKNSGRLLPYFASLITFVGLMTHFLMMAFSSRPVAQGRRKK